MLKRFLKMFGRTAPEEQGEQITTYRDGVYEAAAGNDDILAGYRFCATLDPRTPLRILERHGTVSATLPAKHDRTDPADGVWTPKVKSWKELGLNIKEFAPSVMASAVGLIPEDGGEFLKMLIAFRQEAESVGTPVERAERAYHVVQSREEWREFAVTLGWSGPESLDDYVGFPETLGVPALSVKLAKSLYAAGFVSKRMVQKATDESLLSIRGIGPKKLSEIRKAFGKSPEA